MNVNLVLNPKPLADGKRNVSIRFTENRQVNYINLGYKVKSTDFKDGRFKNEFLDQNEILNKAIVKAEKIIIKMVSDGSNGFQTFKKLYFEETSERPKTPKPKKLLDFFHYAESYENELIERGKLGNAKIYRVSYHKLLAYNSNLTFNKITTKFLKDFVIWMSDTGVSGNYQSMVLRSIRSLFNKAIGEKLIDQSIYPFKNILNPNGFSPASLETVTKKRTLTENEMDTIKRYKPKSERERLALDIFLFSYYAAGINITDIANLTESNIQDDRIFYVRQKTGKEYNIKINNYLLKIIQRYKGVNVPYLLPILKMEFSDPQQKMDRIHKINGQVNQDLKQIAKDLNINKPLSTYWARHTLATRLYHNNVNIGVISQILGHSDIKTTQIYLQGFSNNVVDKILEDIL